MSAPVDDGGPAQTQPQEEYMAMMREANSPETKDRNLRDYFAGLALQGGLSSTETLQQAALMCFQAGGKVTLEQMLAVRSYAFADAMLAARKEQP